MKSITKTTIAVIALFGFSASAHAADWSNVTIPSVPVTPLAPGFSAGLDTDHYVAVDGAGAYVPNTQVNDDGTFKATCDGCEWREKTAAELIDATPGGPNDPSNAQHDDPNIVAHNTVTKDTAKIGIKGATFSNDDGSKTTINKNGVKTNGEVVVKGVKVGETLDEHNNRITANTDKNDQQDGRLDAVETKNDDQDATLADHESRITVNKAKNDEQDTRLNGHDTQLADHETRITTNTAKNVEQDGRLDTVEDKNDEQDGRLNGHDSTLSNHETRISANKAKNDQQDDRLDGHDATLVNHNNRINTNAENIAINSGDIAANANGIAHNSVLIDELTGGLAAVAAMPDSYLNPTENFSIAAGFGGYSDKTAFGVLGTARISGNLSAYGGASIPLDDGDIAWKVGGRVGF